MSMAMQPHHAWLKVQSTREAHAAEDARYGRICILLIITATADAHGGAVACEMEYNERFPLH